MPIFWGVALFIGAVWAVLSFAPTGVRTESQAKMKDKFQIPVNSKDRIKGKLYGTRRLKSPNLIDYGRYSTKAIWSDEVYD